MKNVAIVMGGYSDESVISLKSGAFVCNHVNTNSYTPYQVHILQNEWYVLIDDAKYPIDTSDFSFCIDSNKITFDVVFNTIHGTPGEDGHLQAYWELLDIPYTGCNFYLSALTFNKKDTLSVVAKYNIPKAQSIYHTKGKTLDTNLIEKELHYPVFVKPNQSGSSLGVSKVQDESQLQDALEKAYDEDPQIIIEQELKGREFSVGVYLKDNKTEVLAITEIISENEFFDYEAKYLGKSTEITPSNISKEEETALVETTQKVYEALGMTGIARCDFIVVEGVPHFIEINTCPGLSPASIFPQQVAYRNISFSDIIDNEIQIALNRKPIWKK